MSEATTAAALPRPAEQFDVEVSVVLPCLNEVRTVGRCIESALESFKALGIQGEIVVADNGSIDGSRVVAEACGARVVPVSERGYGRALDAGIRQASGRFVIMADSDDSYDLRRFGHLLKELRAGHDLVVGNRFKGGILPGAMPWHHRYIGNPALTGLLNILFRSPIGDAHCGLRGIVRCAYDRLELRSPGMEYASEMVVKACLNGLKMSEVPIVYHPDGREGRTHLRPIRDGLRHVLLLLALFWQARFSNPLNRGRGTAYEVRSCAGSNPWTWGARGGLTLLTITAAGAAARYLPSVRHDQLAGRAPSASAAPSRIQLGRLDPGQSAKATTTITNRGSAPLMIRRFETSCPCVSVSPRSLRLEPSDASQVVVSYDPEDEPEFLGKLGVEVVALRDDGTEILRMMVELQIVQTETASLR